jgi:hypothetical protein
MLAYVFWHWPKSGVPIEEYETRVWEFQETLRRDGPAERMDSVVWRVRGAGWLPAGAGYEEWYTLPDTGALQSLNDGAVSGAVRGPHDAVARLAAGGTAGLYRPVNPGNTSLLARTAQWFSKPAGTTYEDLAGQVPGEDALWMRMMTLGPTPECCLLGDATAPDGWGVQTVRRTLVWATGDGDG